MELENVEAIYFPILLAKNGEIDALGQLSPGARYRTRPLFDITRPKPGKSLAAHVCGIVQGLAKSWGISSPLYLDLSRFEPDVRTEDGRSLVDHVFDCARQCGLKAIPVSGPLLTRGPGTEYIDAVRDIGRALASGVAIRIPFPMFRDAAQLAESIDECIRLLETRDEEVDLFLDYELLAVLPETEQSESALWSYWHSAINILGNRNFRNVVVCASNVPASIPKMVDNKPLRVPRVDMSAWRTLNNGLRRDVAFGDYGARYPNVSETVAKVIPPGPIHFSTDTESLFFKASRDLHRELNRLAAESREFLDLPDSWGKREVHDAGVGRSGVGGPKDWASRDTNMHIEGTVAYLETQLRLTRRIADIPTTMLDLTPWGQTSIS